MSRYAWRLLRAGPLRLDGGSMFGVVPRVIWSKAITPDVDGRIGIAHNCLLLQPEDTPPGTGEILIETGSGNKFDEKSRSIFGLSDRWIGDALTEARTSRERLVHVIVSHLHFDHGGGLTCRAEGSTSDVELTFPNAPIIVQRREWEDACTGSSVMTRTYLMENLEPIRERLQLVESPTPFPPGFHPRRDEAPPSNLKDRMTEVLPGIFVFSIPGHTWGQQAILFTDDQGRTVVFSADLIPTVNHVGAAYNMAYDVEPYTSTVTRRWFLEAAHQGNWLLVLDHEAGDPLCRVRPDGKGWFALTRERSPDVT